MKTKHEPNNQATADPTHNRITDIIKDRGWEHLPAHLRENRIPTVSSENTRDQQPGGAAAENQTCEPNDSERLYWLQRNLRGSELRRLGLNMNWTGDRQEFRERLDAQIFRENTRDQHPGPCRREPTIKRAKTELSPYWYGFGALLVTPLSAIIFVLMGLMIILAWPLIPFLCYLQKKEEMSKTNTQDQQTGGGKEGK